MISTFLGDVNLDIAHDGAILQGKKAGGTGVLELSIHSQSNGILEHALSSQNLADFQSVATKTLASRGRGRNWKSRNCKYQIELWRSMWQGALVHQMVHRLTRRTWPFLWADVDITCVEVSFVCLHEVISSCIAWWIAQIVSKSFISSWLRTLSLNASLLHVEKVFSIFDGKLSFACL